MAASYSSFEEKMSQMAASEQKTESMSITKHKKQHFQYATIKQINSGMVWKNEKEFMHTVCICGTVEAICDIHGYPRILMLFDYTGKLVVECMKNEEIYDVSIQNVLDDLRCV